MRQSGIYVIMIWKRMWRTPGYLPAFFLVPAVLILLSFLTERETAQVVAAVYLEIPEAESAVESEHRKKMESMEASERMKVPERMEETECMERGQEGILLIRKTAVRLLERDGAVRFLICTSEEEVQAQVASGRAQCGYVLSDQLFERLKEGRYARSIKSYSSTASGQHTICDEVLFAELFSVYEEMTFGEQVSEFFLSKKESGGENAGGETAGGSVGKSDTESETAESKAGEIETAETEAARIEAAQMKRRAEELFEKYLSNGSTFRFTYETYSENEENEKNEKSGIEEMGTDKKEMGETEISETEISETESSKIKISEAGLIPVRGIMAFMIYICGLCGTLENLEDAAWGRTLRLKYRGVFQVLTIWIPTFFMSLIAWAVFAVTGSLGDVASMGEELFRLFWYSCIVTVYGCIVKRIWRSEESFLSAMPVLILSAAVVCPVFIDLSAFLPVLRVLEKFYPLSYYLRR